MLTHTLTHIPPKKTNKQTPNKEKYTNRIPDYFLTYCRNNSLDRKLHFIHFLSHQTDAVMKRDLVGADE